MILFLDMLLSMSIIICGSYYIKVNVIVFDLILFDNLKEQPMLQKQMVRITQSSHNVYHVSQLHLI